MNKKAAGNIKPNLAFGWNGIRFPRWATWVMAAVGVLGTKACRIGGARCRSYKGTLALSWLQSGLSYKHLYDPVTNANVADSKPNDPKSHRAPAQPGRLTVVFEDPCWGFIEAYANRSRVFERLHRWMN